MAEDLPDDKIEELTQALLSGQKINAIKVYREFTGASLRESKEAVEHMEASLREQFPDKFKAGPSAKGKGCSVSAACFFLLIGFYWLLEL